MQGNFLAVAIQPPSKTQCPLEILLKLQSSLIPHLPDKTQISGFRKMTEKDLEQIYELIKKKK